MFQATIAEYLILFTINRLPLINTASDYTRVQCTTSEDVYENSIYRPEFDLDIFLFSKKYVYVLKCWV